MTLDGLIDDLYWASVPFYWAAAPFVIFWGAWRFLLWVRSK